MSSINNNANEIVGIVINGDTWKIGKLKGKIFKKNNAAFSYFDNDIKKWKRCAGFSL